MARMNRITLAFLFPLPLLLTLPAIAQELPNAPTPKPMTQTERVMESHRFFDNQNNIALSASFGIRVTDTIETCRLLRKRVIATLPDGSMAVFPYFEEVNAPVKSCGGVAAWNGGMTFAAFGASWLLHKTGHHRLERIPNWINFAGSAEGFIQNLFLHLDKSRLRGFPPGTTYTVR